MPKTAPLVVFIIVTILLYQHAFAQNKIMPVDGGRVYSKHVYFQWESIQNVERYQLKIALDEGENPFNEHLVFNGFDDSHARIIRNGLDFGQDYIWTTRGLPEKGEPHKWSPTYRFRIIDVPDSLLNAFAPDVLVPEHMQPGISLCSPYGITCGIEHSGELVWCLMGEGGWWTNGQWDIKQQPNGNFQALHQGGIRIFNVENDTLDFIFNPQCNSLHHEANLKPDGNYLALGHSYRWIEKNGDSTRWKGDLIVELSPQNEILWTWYSFDYISTEDFNEGFFNEVPPGGLFDWTHCNACPIDEEEGAIYLSVRDLSRVIKIDYPSGRVLWSMGQQMASGDVDFGDDLDIIHQHATVPLEGNDLLLYDNHWIPHSDYSRAMILNIDPQRNDPVEVIWEFRHDFSSVMGNSTKLANGNILINSGRSKSFYEVTQDGEVVWEVHLDLHRESYRIQRIPSLYPVMFTFNTPADSSEIPTWHSYTQMKINNEGESDQVFCYQIYDSNDWIRYESGSVFIQSEKSAIVTALGNVPPVDDWDQIVYIVYPQIAPEKADTSIIMVYPGEPVAVEGVIPDRANTFLQTFPNPFNERLLISYKLPVPGDTRIVLYDLRGRVIKEKLSGFQRPGVYSYVMDGQGLNSGLYLLMVDQPQQVQIRRVTFLK